MMFKGLCSPVLVFSREAERIGDSYAMSMSVSMPIPISPLSIFISYIHVYVCISIFLSRDGEELILSNWFTSLGQWANPKSVD